MFYINFYNKILNYFLIKNNSFNHRFFVYSGMKLLITGSRAVAENDANFRRLSLEIQSRYSVLGTGCLDEQGHGAGRHLSLMAILHGGAQGADQLADRFGKEQGLPVEVIRPDYRQYPDRLAPLMRNTELVARADAVIAFYGPKARTGGTWDTVKKALARNLPVTELLADGSTQHTPAQLSLFP